MPPRRGSNLTVSGKPASLCLWWVLVALNPLFTIYVVMRKSTLNVPCEEVKKKSC